MTTDFVGETIIPFRVDFYFSNAFIAITTLLYSFLFKFLQGWFEQEKKISQIEVAQLSTELKYLRAQINPHFLFNTLNNLYGLALKKSDKTPEVVMRLSEIMDYMLYESNESKVPLKKDVDNLINYIEIERIRQGNNAKIDFTITGEIKTQKIIPLLMLPLFENGFKHGVNKEMANAYLNSHLDVTQTFIELTVINNKPIVPAEKDDGHGIGLQNLRKRLELFYPQKHRLSIVQKPDSYKVYLKIELI
jgi:LytS/YehU family sensor histidine kinase